MSGSLAWRHMVRHWGITLLLVANTLFGGTVAAAFPIYGAALADSALQVRLREAPVAARSLTYRGEISPLEVADLDERLGPLVSERVQFRQRQFSASPIIQHEDGTTDQTSYTSLLMHLWSIEPLSAHAELVEGRMPAAVTSRPPGARLQPPTVEAVIGTSAAEVLGLRPGDLLRAQQTPLNINIVGVVRPLDPTNEIWRGDASLVPFSAWSLVNPDFEIMTVSILLPTRTMEAFVTPLSEWRYVLDMTAIDGDNVDRVLENLLSARAQLGGPNKTIDTGLIDLIEAFQSERRQAEMVARLLMAQSLLAILAGVGLLAHFAVEQAQISLTTLARRGFSALQEAAAIALGPMLLFAATAAVAPGLALAAVRLIAAASPDLLLVRVPAMAWVYSAGVALACGITLLVTSYLGARRLGGPVRPEAWRPKDAVRRPVWLFEVFFIALSGLAYWQLRQVTGARGADASTIDPDLLLFLAPTLLLLVGGLAVMRLLPRLMRGVARLARQTSGLLWTIGPTRLARDPGPSVQVAVLLVWTTALSVFASVTGHALVRQQGYAALYEAGADVRLVWPASANRDDIDARPDVLATSLVVRGMARVPDPAARATEPVPFLAVEPDTLPRVSAIPPGLSPFTLRTVVQTIGGSAGGPIPIILSNDRALGHLKRGDRIAVQFDLAAVEMEVVAIIDTFPTLSGPYLVAPLEALESAVDLRYPLGQAPAVHELWVNVDNAVQERSGEWGLDVIATADGTLEQLQQDLVTRQAMASLRLNAQVLAAITAVAFVTIQYFAFRRRLPEIAVLRALGVGRRQWLGALAIEAVIVLVLGTAVGVGFGFGLAWLMRPLIRLLLAATLGGSAALQLETGLQVWGSGVATLSLVFVGALLALQLLLARLDISRRLRVDQE